ncbi:MAG: sugar phosphate isomerase [Gammaproteobacteria bacterium]|nr:MAG: sugar phosphate isomerase [Gammaproteobacteria bacterium]
MHLSRYDSHLCYCSNIHPGEDWAAVFAALERHVPAVKRALRLGGAALGLGLRLGAAAVAELRERPAARAAFRRWLKDENVYVYTVNGFPYGEFHEGPVKAAVYRPDWADPARLAYTLDLAELLAEWLPPGLDGSISTVPIGWRADFSGPERLDAAEAQLLAAAATLYARAAAGGPRIALALEPEPGCVWESSAEVIDGFRRLRSAPALAAFRRHLPPALRGAGEAELLQHLGVCLDACHHAVLYEPPRLAWQRLRRAGVPVFKLQLTAALEVSCLDAGARRALAEWCDPVWLHQCSVLPPGGRRRFHPDLPEALAEAPDGAALRSHFHLPLHAAPGAPLASTAGEVAALLDDWRRSAACRHLEVETYTFDRLPEPLRAGGVAASLAAELDWVRARLA